MRMLWGDSLFSERQLCFIFCFVKGLWRSMHREAVQSVGGKDRSLSVSWRAAARSEPPWINATYSVPSSALYSSWFSWCLVWLSTAFICKMFSEALCGKSVWWWIWPKHLHETAEHQIHRNGLKHWEFLRLFCFQLQGKRVGIILT